MSKDFMLTLLVQGGMGLGLFVMMAYHIGLSTAELHWQAPWRLLLTLARLFHGFDCHADASIFKLGLKSNKYSLMAFAAGLILCLLNAVLFIPAFHGLLSIADLTWQMSAQSICWHLSQPC